MGWHLQGKTALVTGAAQGLGEGIARRLHARGMNVLLTGLQPERLHALELELGPRSLAIEADVCSLAQMQAAVAQACSRFGGLDVVVANAGITAFAPLAEIDAELFRKVLDVNVLGVFNTLQASASEVMARQGYFQIMASMATAIHSPLQAHYCASKAAVWALANSFRLEARSQGAEVGTVHPTFAATAMMQQTHADAAGREIWKGNTGLWTMVRPEAVIDAAVNAIENRTRIVSVPKRLLPVLLSPGLFQPLLERSFTNLRVQRMVDAFRSGRKKGVSA